MSKKGGNIAILTIDFHKGKKIERAVNNTIKEPEFSEVSRISIKPYELNNDYLRASMPKHTMFYGSVISDIDLKKGNMKYERFTSFAEISNLMNDNKITEGNT